MRDRVEVLSALQSQGVIQVFYHLDTSVCAAISLRVRGAVELARQVRTSLS